MIYLLLGEDSSAKDQKIADLKRKFLPSAEALEFDYEVIDGDKLEPSTLKKALIALPAAAKKRMVVIRSAHKLNSQNKKMVLEFAQSGTDHAVLILDFPQSGQKDHFTAALNPMAQTIQFQQPAKYNVFDMTRAISARRPVEAIKILSVLVSEGNHPLQIMGGLVWFWGKSKDRLSVEGFKKGLLALQEADWNIKRSRLKPEYALEVAVTKLCLAGGSQSG